MPREVLAPAMSDGSTLSFAPPVATDNDASDAKLVKPSITDAKPVPAEIAFVGLAVNPDNAPVPLRIDLSIALARRLVAAALKKSSNGNTVSSYSSLAK